MLQVPEQRGRGEGGFHVPTKLEEEDHLRGRVYQVHYFCLIKANHPVDFPRIRTQAKLFNPVNRARIQPSNDFNVVKREKCLISYHVL